MKLKNLLAYTLTGLFLCTSCIKEEAPNAEADILSCTLPAEMTDPQTTIDVEVPFDEEINAYPIKIEVKAGTDITKIAPEFTLTPGAAITPESGTIQDFTSPVNYVVVSQDKHWSRIYKITVTVKEDAKPEDPPTIPVVFNFENVKKVTDYYVFYDKNEITTLDWASGNEGFAWTGSGGSPDQYPTTQINEGRNGKCLKLETLLTGPLGNMVNKPLAAGNIFIGKFNLGVAISRPLEATLFGTPFNFKPTRLVGYYQYKAGPRFYQNGEYTDKKDIFNIYAIFYERTDDISMIDGHIARNNYAHENMVAAAVIDDPHETTGWERFELDFNYARYGKTIDPDKLKAGKYNISIIFASSKDGDIFEGAPGSTLLIDDVELEYEP